MLRLEAQPQKYRSPSRKGGISPASRAVESRAGLKLRQSAGQGTAPRPESGLRVRSQTPAEVKAISAKESQACATDSAQSKALWPSLSPFRGSIATLNPPATFPDSTPVKPARLPNASAGPECSMNKELFVSSTPHETKVGLVEDDLLAEVYLERENEYTLAGSIYKGRVTRVLPGMQSAFVDIGLERDAFLYVSDFMELEEHDDDLTDVVPATRNVPDLRQQPAQDGSCRERCRRTETAGPPETDLQP